MAPAVGSRLPKGCFHLATSKSAHEPGNLLSRGTRCRHIERFAIATVNFLARLSRCPTRCLRANFLAQPVCPKTMLPLSELSAQ